MVLNALVGVVTPGIVTLSMVVQAGRSGQNAGLADRVLQLFFRLKLLKCFLSLVTRKV